MEKIRLSYSRINTFQRCHKAYEWSYIHSLKPKNKSPRLMIGDIVHKLLHLWYTKQLTVDILTNLEEYVLSIYKNSTEELATEVALEAARLVRGYFQKYADDPLQFISSEVWLETELENCILFGRVDALARNEEKKLWRFEHKTASKADQAYLTGLRGGLQGTIYDFLVEFQFKEPVAGTIYNLLIKTKEPNYLRTFTQINPRAKSLMLQTVNGVAEDILRCKEKCNFYPSCNCYMFNTECDYKTLCNHDSAQTREAFYDVVKEDEPKA